MKRNLLAVLILTAFFSVKAWAQQPAPVSKEEKEIAKLQLKLTEDRDKLSQLYQDKDKQETARDKKQTDALSAADKNAEMAQKLSNDSGNKSKAKKAKKSAKKAESKAKSARKADSRVKQTEKKIRKLEKSIPKDEAKLKKLQAKVG